MAALPRNSRCLKEIDTWKRRHFTQSRTAIVREAFGLPECGPPTRVSEVEIEQISADREPFHTRVNIATPMISHIVLFKFRAEATDDEIGYPIA